MVSRSWVGAVALVGMAFAVCAHANTFTVTTTADGGSGSLRQAIIDANAMTVTGGGACVPHSIVFAIPGDAPHTIQPLSELPPLAISITMNAYTQPGAAENTLDQGDNAVLGIELDGSLAGVGASGLVIAPSTPGSGLCGGSGSTIRGFAINRFDGGGITAIGETCPLGFSCGVGGVTISGNFIGTDVTGTVALPNAYGLEFGLHTSQNIVGDKLAVVGGPISPAAASRNIIAGNLADGIYLSSADPMNASEGHQIRNNYIGIGASGTTALPNGRNGVFADIGASGALIYENLIGGHPGDGIKIEDNVLGFTNVVGNSIGMGLGGVPIPNAGDGVHISASVRAVSVGLRYPYFPLGSINIAYNGGAGVFVEGDSSGVDLIAAGIGRNGGLGFDLTPRGVNPQNPVQPDVGPNEALNAPVLTSLDFNPANSALTIHGTLDTPPNSQIELHFYRSDTCNASGYGDGQQDFDFVNVTTDATGHAEFTRNTQVLANSYITAFSRRFASAPADSTIIVSEFSNCLQASVDPIFSSGFDP